MRFAVSVFGRCVFEVSTETAMTADTRPSMEATSGGQFEIGFSPPRGGEVTCRQIRDATS